MTDLISRLRSLSRPGGGGTIGNEAADEIGRLTKKLEATQSNLCSLQCFFEDWKVAHSTVQKDVEIERLKRLNGALTDKGNAYVIHNARLAEENTRMRSVLGEIEWSNDTTWQSEAARAALKEPT